MQIELTEEGYTLDGKWKLVPVECTREMIDKLPKGKAGKTVTIGSKYNDLVSISPKPDFNIDWCNFCGATIGDEHLPMCGNK